VKPPGATSSSGGFERIGSTIKKMADKWFPPIP
jgi:hypothetical protein